MGSLGRFVDCSVACASWPPGLGSCAATSPKRDPAGSTRWGRRSCRVSSAKSMKKKTRKNSSPTSYPSYITLVAAPLNPWQNYIDIKTNTTIQWFELEMEIGVVLWKNWFFYWTRTQHGHHHESRNGVPWGRRTLVAMGGTLRYWFKQKGQRWWPWPRKPCFGLSSTQ